MLHTEEQIETRNKASQMGIPSACSTFRRDHPEESCSCSDACRETYQQVRCCSLPHVKDLAFKPCMGTKLFLCFIYSGPTKTLDLKEV